MAVTKLAIDPDFGMVSFEIGDTSTPKFDLYLANDNYASLVQKHTAASPDDSADPATDWDAVWGDFRKYLGTLGFPESLSLAAVMAVAANIAKSARDLAGKDLQPAS